jgi:hypothetical protein
VIVKKFVYFESTEGGMETHVVWDEEELMILTGWRSESTEKEDLDLMDWMRNAKLGEFYDHRLGTLVCVRNTCSTCHGAGMLDDAAPGDIFFNTWKCPDCYGGRT